ncbi:MAG: hypothetical protein K2H46_02455 [Muribaculaceae bacterium]|nr:hypothetical protein [Muribaculaceae bacterium]
MKTIIKKFESLGALSSFIANTPACGFFANQVLYSKATNDVNFFGSESFEAANNMMLQGWSEGAARVQKYMNAGVTATAPKRVIYNSVVGFAPNVPNYLAGNPLNMYNQKRVRTPKKVVTIVYNCFVGWTVKSAKIEKAAAALFNVISGLEASGVRVELWIGCFTHSSSKTEYLYNAVKVKSAGQPFNLLKMIYPVVHPSFFRRHMFAIEERAGLNACWEDYGVAITGKEGQQKACQALRIPSDNVFNYYDLTGKTESEIAKMIK